MSSQYFDRRFIAGFHELIQIRTSNMNTITEFLFNYTIVSGEFILSRQLFHEFRFIGREQMNVSIRRIDQPGEISTS